MASYIEASSLSSDITQLASNPPKYPRNPTEKKRDPLTLYIARVPGSRDVILTALKPQLKSTTAQDVANSLYYFHLNTEDDARLMNDEHFTRLEDEEQFAPVQKPFPRKPLPESARSSVEINRQSSAVPEPLSVSNINRKIERKPLGSSVQQTGHHVKAEGEDDHKKPSGPRPLLSEPYLSRKPLRDMEMRPTSSGSASESPTRETESKYEIMESSRPKIPSSSHVPTPQKSFMITVIRRDASSGAQWNVGAVFGESHDQEPVSPSSTKGFFDISVHLTAPGYTKFRDTQARPHNEASTASHSISTSESQHLRDQESPFSGAGFDRQIRMEGISFWDRSKQHKRAQSDVPGMQKSTRGRSGTTGSPELDSFTSDQTRSHSSGVKGYVFTSPWGGRCKFSTSGSGRSLRCKHTLPSAVSSSTSPDSTSSSQITVSELRFNLPSSAVFQFPTSPPLSGRENDPKRFHIPKFSQIRSRLSPDKPRPPLPPRPDATSYAAMYPSDDERPPLPPRLDSNIYAESSEDDLEEVPSVTDRLHPFPLNTKLSSDEGDGRLDLSLGQEKAGGGNSGKRVKLGKLIIMDEGAKMLDLIVAANMGIWWSVWESRI